MLQEGGPIGTCYSLFVKCVLLGVLGSFCVLNILDTVHHIPLQATFPIQLFKASVGTPTTLTLGRIIFHSFRVFLRVAISVPGAYRRAAVSSQAGDIGPPALTDLPQWGGHLFPAAKRFPAGFFGGGGSKFGRQILGTQGGKCLGPSHVVGFEFRQLSSFTICHES